MWTTNFHLQATNCIKMQAGNYNGRNISSLDLLRTIDIHLHSTSLNGDYDLRPIILVCSISLCFLIWYQERPFTQSKKILLIKKSPFV